MVFFSPEMIIGALFISTGALLKFYPPKSRNIYGYRTPLSMKNARNWEEGNKLSAKLLMLSGCLILLTDFTLLVIIPSNIATRVLICISLMIITSILTIIITEKKLKEIDKTNPS
jgi:uncharacterized membrane protein